MTEFVVDRKALLPRGKKLLTRIKDGTAKWEELLGFGMWEDGVAARRFRDAFQKDAVFREVMTEANIEENEWGDWHMLSLREEKLLRSLSALIWNLRIRLDDAEKDIADAHDTINNLRDALNQ